MKFAGPSKVPLDEVSKGWAETGTLRVRWRRWRRRWRRRRAETAGLLQLCTDNHTQNAPEMPTRTKSGAQKQPNKCNAPASVRAQQGTRASPPVSAPTQSDPRIPRLRRKHVCTWSTRAQNKKETFQKKGWRREAAPVGSNWKHEAAPQSRVRSPLRREREAETGVRIAGPLPGIISDLVRSAVSLTISP